jgi:uncharacterized protein
MTTHEEPALTAGLAPAAGAPPGPWIGGPGHAFPITAPGVPLSAYAFAFAVAYLGLIKTGILSGAASDIFIATAFGIGALGLLVGGLWEFRAGELFGGTFGVAYSGFLISTGIILKYMAPAMIASAGLNNFNHAFAAWLIMWGLFTLVFAIGARTISLGATAPFALACFVFALLAAGTLGGASGWASDLARVGGWFAIADGLAAGYLASALVINTAYAKDLLPLLPTKAAGLRT